MAPERLNYQWYFTPSITGLFVRQMFDGSAGEFVTHEIAPPVTAFVTAGGGGGAAIADSLLAGPAGLDCIVFDNKSCAVGGITGCGREIGSARSYGLFVADGISTRAGAGIVICGRAGSGTTVAAAAAGTFVRTVACCPPKAAGTRLAISQVPTSSRTILTLGKLTENRDGV